jgi:hypothetical protein
VLERAFLLMQGVRQPPEGMFAGDSVFELHEII